MTISKIGAAVVIGMISIAGIAQGDDKKADSYTSKKYGFEFNIKGLEKKKAANWEIGKEEEKDESLHINLKNDDEDVTTYITAQYIDATKYQVPTPDKIIDDLEKNITGKKGTDYKDVKKLDYKKKAKFFNGADACYLKMEIQGMDDSKRIEEFYAFKGPGTVIYYTETVYKDEKRYVKKVQQDHLLILRTMRLFAAKR